MKTNQTTQPKDKFTIAVESVLIRNVKDGSIDIIDTSIESILSEIKSEMREKKTNSYKICACCGSFAHGNIEHNIS